MSVAHEFVGGPYDGRKDIQTPACLLWYQVVTGVPLSSLLAALDDKPVERQKHFYSLVDGTWQYQGVR